MAINLKKYKNMKNSLKSQVRLTKNFIDLSDSRKAIISRLTKEKKKLLFCLNVFDEVLGEAVTRDRLNELMKVKAFRKALKISKRYIGD